MFVAWRVFISDGSKPATSLLFFQVLQGKHAFDTACAILAALCLGWGNGRYHVEVHPQR